MHAFAARGCDEAVTAQRARIDKIVTTAFMIALILAITIDGVFRRKIPGVPLNGKTGGRPLGRPR